jgi:hypothetical protein
VPPANTFEVANEGLIVTRSSLGRSEPAGLLFGAVNRRGYMGKHAQERLEFVSPGSASVDPLVDFIRLDGGVAVVPNGKLDTLRRLNIRRRVRLVSSRLFVGL